MGERKSGLGAVERAIEHAWGEAQSTSTLIPVDRPEQSELLGSVRGRRAPSSMSELQKSAWLAVSLSLFYLPRATTA